MLLRLGPPPTDFSFEAEEDVARFELAARKIAFARVLGLISGQLRSWYLESVSNMDRDFDGSGRLARDFFKKKYH